ncbi:MAG: NADH-quinone oxidoreductase subunit N [Actinobacteria bacterium]|nr:NADH-quinone oxidoreductase subunit N [Actinomycetota bacterium]
MSLPLGEVLPELVLVVGTVLTLMWALFAPRRRQAATALVALAVLGAAAVATAVLLVDPPGSTFFGTYAADPTALWAKLIIIVGTAAAVGLSVEWFASDPRHGDLYVLVLFTALGSALMAGATDLMELTIGILLSSAASFALAAFHRRSPASGEAGIKYFLVGGLANAGLLYGSALLFGLAGTTVYAGFRAGLAGADAAALAAAFALVAVGLAFKLGAVPVHQWVPDVAHGSPAPMAALITAIPKVGSLIAIARLAAAIGDSPVGWRPIVAVLSAATMTIGNLAALWQDDVRRLLGWSAVSMTGYGLMGVVAVGRSDIAVPSILYFLLAYVVGNLAAFGVVVELRGRSDIASYSGLARSRPLLFAVLVVAFLSFVGIPPLGGFVAKLELFLATIDAGYAWLAVLAVANTVVSLFYYLRVLGPGYFEAPAPTPLPVLGRWSAVATVTCAAALIAMGLVAQPLLRAFQDGGLLPR